MRRSSKPPLLAAAVRGQWRLDAVALRRTYRTPPHVRDPSAKMALSNCFANAAIFSRMAVSQARV